MRHLNAVTDLAYASDIPDRNQNFFLILLRSDITSDRCGAIFSNSNIDLFGARQIKSIDMFFQLIGPIFFTVAGDGIPYFFARLFHKI